MRIRIIAAILLFAGIGSAQTAKRPFTFEDMMAWQRVSERFQLFTTLQRLKVPSKMLYFADEGDWVLEPQNSRLCDKTVNEWVDQWTAQK